MLYNKEYMAKYRKTKKYKDYRKEYQKKYHKTAKWKAYKKAYKKTDKFKASRKRYYLKNKRENIIYECIEKLEEEYIWMTGWNNGEEITFDNFKQSLQKLIK